MRSYVTDTVKNSYAIKPSNLSTLPTDPARQLYVFRHDRDALRVDGAQVRVLEQSHQVRLAGLLQSSDGGRLESEIGLEVLRDFPHQTLEGQLADQQLGGFLVSADLAQGHRSGAVAMGLLDAAGGRRRLPRRLGRELLPGGFPSRRFTSRLLGTRHILPTQICCDN